jgi:hypothetical protein
MKKTVALRINIQEDINHKPPNTHQQHNTSPGEPRFAWAAAIIAGENIPVTMGTLPQKPPSSESQLRVLS